ncbi:MAG: carboxylic ester hydrolase [Pedosphaera sp.]|nr:carboxylic ester hydrolase [Pedosphaera sp.]
MTYKSIVFAAEYRMRSLEISLLLVNLPILLWGLLARRRKPVWLGVFSWLGLILLIFHLQLEGYRWQMMPAYFATGCLCLANLISFFRRDSLSPPHRALTKLGNLFGLGLLGIAGMLSILLPVFQFPAPTGPCRVGTTVLHLVDNSRAETFSKNPKDHRELMVQIWYPAEPAADAKPQYYLSNLAGAKSPNLNQQVMGFRFSHLDQVQTHSYPDAPLSQSKQKYPILVFSPAWSGSRIQNTFQMEELASHGFVVAGIDHTYCTGVTVFPDGRVLYSDPSLDLDFSTDEAVQKYIHTAAEQARVRAEDARFVLDQLEQLNVTDPRGVFTGRLDVTRVGILGHSFGGTVAAEACWLDKRFKAGLNMDGMLFGDAVESGVAQPFMFMNSDDLPPTPAEMARSSSAKLDARSFRVQDEYLARNGGYDLTFDNTKHANFTDTALFSPFRRFTGSGSINARRCQRIVNDYCLAFFESELNGTISPLLNGPAAAYPEVQFKKHSNQRP